MASLNLLNWRQPGWRHQLSVHKARLISINLFLFLIAVAYWFSYQPMLVQVTTAVTANQQRLAQLPELERRYQRVIEASQQQQKVELINRQQAAVIDHFVRLSEISEPELQLLNITWLPGELTLSGNYQNTDKVKQLTTRLQQQLGGSDIKVSFPRTNQFSIIYREDSRL